MGRRRIDIKPLNSERDRYQTFCRRRSGFLKKGQELSVLCDVSIVVMVQVKGSGACAFYSSDHPEDATCPGWEDRLVSSVMKARKQGVLIDSRRFSDCIPADSGDKAGPLCVTLTKRSPGAFAGTMGMGGCAGPNGGPGARQRGKRRPETASTPCEADDHARPRFILPVAGDSLADELSTETAAISPEDPKTALESIYLCNYTVMRLHEALGSCELSEELVPRHAPEIASAHNPFQSQWEDTAILGIPLRMTSNGT